MKPRLDEAAYEIEGHILHSSGFNLTWFDYFGIVPKLIVDVGAFDFGDSIRFKKRFPAANVFAYELDEDNYSKHSKYAQDCGVITNNIAICDENKIVDGYWKAINKGHHENAQGSLLEPTQSYKNDYPYITHEYTDKHVVGARLDSLFEDTIDLLHEDTEGGELKVLNGLGELRPKLIWVEYLVDGGWVGQNFNDVDG